MKDTIHKYAAILFFEFLLIFGIFSNKSRAIYELKNPVYAIYLNKHLIKRHLLFEPIPLDLLRLFHLILLAFLMTYNISSINILNCSDLSHDFLYI